ncbi:MAG: type II toxin-antitoxin system RelE/ParE family toxin [Proteobacteria bacterium]|nr:type II toxin-antitoxin system RelE/ParE family toxin [Pseudomonadota bacterium]
MYEIEITAEGLRHLNKLPEKVRDAALESIFGPISENPNRLGMPLVGEVEGLWSARRGDYRIIYEIFEDDQTVLIHRVQHRRDAYRPR